MKSESHQHDSPVEELRLPPEILAALASRQAAPVTVPPELDAAILGAAFAMLPTCRRDRRPRLVRRLLWPAAAAACLALAFTMIRQAPRAGAELPVADKLQEDAAAIILREFSVLYPNQIRAIIQDQTGIRLDLADTPEVHSGQALFLRVCQPQGCKEIITFSGQLIDVAGFPVTVRAENDGRVILDGGQFRWSSDVKESPVPGIRIESRRL